MTPSPLDAIPREAITGVILCGGQGSRMGGIDKGWIDFDGQPLVQHALARFAPQVGTLLISANRNIDRYAALAPVVTDTEPDFPGPLAGIVAALHATTTPYLACIPCDVPRLPSDLVQGLAHGLLYQAGEDGAATVAVAATHDTTGRRVHPVIALIDRTILDSSEAGLRQGERRMMSWLRRHNGRTVDFADSTAFYNINTPALLEHASDATP
ncbi:molybdenum cofactor guanylyltransferase MobA [Robbsia sp. KACC 23696]|uniref:molybdenum cofactor guanylyltransferase MobA n=1 Tax=Robbsia sp. KACC 23696 TaxID=3149231 RepID=UPI00325AD915